MQVPIYGLAFGSGAGFDLIKDVSDETNGFVQRIYDSGNSFEQLEDFYNQISGNKLIIIVQAQLIRDHQCITTA